MKNIKDIFKILLIKIFLFYRDKFKFKPIVLGQVFNGIGIGLISNTIFVVTTDQNTDSIRLIFSFLFAIIFIVIGNVQRKD